MLLKGYGKTIKNTFDILGKTENDLTKSIAFCLYKSSKFLESFLNELLSKNIKYELSNVVVSYQQKQIEGITDLEIYQIGLFHIIIEAKKGSEMPNNSQIKKYVNNLNNMEDVDRTLVVLNNNNYVDIIKKIKKSKSKVHIKHISYKKIINIIEKVIRIEKKENRKILNELSQYIKEVTNMKDNHSNIVYVVPIKNESIKEHNELRQYHCPVKYLVEPTNYLGFRYYGKLQSINYVENVEIYEEDCKKMYKFTLGPDIVPQKEVKTGGKLQGTKFYCDIDLLLTCDTIVEANNKTKERK